MKTNRLLSVLTALLFVALGMSLAYRFNLWNIRGVEPSDSNKGFISLGLTEVLSQNESTRSMIFFFAFQRS